MLQTVAELDDWCADACSFEDGVFWNIDNDVTPERNGECNASPSS
jgi:hypothetical protein